MINKKPGLLAACCMAGLIFAAAPAAAEIVVKVGTWSTSPNPPNPGGFAQGGKFVVQADYNPASIVFDPFTGFFRADLTNPGSFLAQIPIEGLGTLAVQTELNHDPLFTPTAQIQFFDAAGTQFRGFEFESSPMAGGLIFEMFTSDVSFGGPPVINSIAQIINGDGGFGIDIRSVTRDVLSNDPLPSGGTQNPGVFLSDAVPVVAEAGANLSYNASTLTLTTNGGTAVVIDPLPLGPPTPGVVRTAPSQFDNPTRQADNDLGAARTDGEDFLTYAWSIDGGGALGGTNATGTRINRVVQDSPNGPVFVNDGNRTVDDVNKTVGIADSGLTSTTDSKTWRVNVTEDMTGNTGSDTLTVSYTNALPTVANATATASGPGNLNLDFALGVDDADLAVNAFIAAFEALMTDLFVDGVNQNLFFADLLNTGAQSVDNATLLAQFGLGLHTFEVIVTDRAGTSDSRLFDFTVLAANGTVPEPSSLALVAIAVAGLAIARRRRSRLRDRS